MHPASIGSFQVLRELGRGGMGEVFLARDTKLDRHVAIKALPADLADNADRLARFQREAKVLAALNHPGIGAIYGFEEVAGRHYFILEYVEGETLADRLARGAVPMEEALPLAAQVAEAVESAHDKGIIHRDLKPSNVMVTAEGAAKVLDFGLARTDDGTALRMPGSGTANSPTLTTPAHVHSPTIPGAIMGTAGYMSPEQARGKPVDKRSDIFSFGCVLYEMLAGEQAFEGEDATSSLAAILHVEPDWARLPANTPPRIRDLLASALQKERKQRLHDIGDARLALERAVQGREWAMPTGAQRAQRRAWAMILAWTLAVLSISVAVVAFWRDFNSRPSRSAAVPQVPIRVRVDDASAPLFIIDDTGNMTISSDGKQVAYSLAFSEHTPVLALRRMDNFNVVRLPMFAPDMFFSPDGRMLGGIRGRYLSTIPVGGGASSTLYTMPPYIASKGGAWGPRGILFAPAPNAGLMLISDKGGEPQVITVPDPKRDEVSHRWPDVLPDGRHVLMTVKKVGILTFNEAEIALLDLDTRTWKTIIRGGTYARYSPTGHIIFARNESILAVPFDAARSEVTGTPVSVVQGVMMSPGSGAAKFALARESGTLAYVPGGSDELRRELIWVDAAGKTEPVGAPIKPYVRAIPAPDGTRIVTSVFGASDSVFVYDIARRTNTRVTYRGNCSDATWMPNGQRVAYTSDVDGAIHLYAMNADGSGNPQRVLAESVRAYRFYVRVVDGKDSVVFEEKGDIWTQSLDGSPRRSIVASQFEETMPHLSPDGRWISYASNETGQMAIYVRPFPSGEGRWQILSDVGEFHCWATDGSALFCTKQRDRQMMRVPFQTSPTVKVGTPEAMFELQDGCSHEFEPTADGRRFLTFRNLPPRGVAPQVFVVLNWDEELKAKVPTGSP